MGTQSSATRRHGARGATRQGSHNHREQGGDKVTPLPPWGHPSPVWEQGDTSHGGFGSATRRLGAVPNSIRALIAATRKLAAGEAAALLLLVFCQITNT